MNQKNDMIRLAIVASLLILFHWSGFAQGLTIQENEVGFCSIDGLAVDTDVEGYTGAGFANADIAAGTSGLWNIKVPADGTYHIYWRYANGGGAGDLVAELWVNEEVFLEDYTFTHTGSWRDWTESDTVAVNLTAGENRIRLVSVSPSGLANLDFFHVVEEGVEPAFCLPSYSLNLSQNFAEAGTVSYEPVQPFYDAGTEVTLTATANADYFFQSWSDGETSTEAVHTFAINRNANIEALFFPTGTTTEKDAAGYVTIQDDAGTPYLLTGGRFGDMVVASNFAALRTFLESDQPYVVTVADSIYSTGTINIKSDKTLLGISERAHLEGIRIKINGADNVVIKNMIFSKVVRFDAIEINNSRHIWIDNCEFFSDLDHDSDYYDGLLDIKNGATFITVSNTEFHHHFKAVLISSGDDSVQDTTIRITFHHNHFHHLGSRTPLLRFGKAHIFNNYFSNCSSGINSRMEACIRVEANYFKHVNRATRTDMSAVGGYFQLIDNIFQTSNYVTEPNCELEVPYEYVSILDDVADVPFIVAGENITNTTSDLPTSINLNIFPNPAKSNLQLSMNIPIATPAKVTFTDVMGKTVVLESEWCLKTGNNELSVSISNLATGTYFVSVATSYGNIVQRFIIH